MRESLLDKQVHVLDRDAGRAHAAGLPRHQGRRPLDPRRRQGDAPTRWSRRSARRWPTKKLIIGTGGGVRSRHVFSIGIDLGLPTGVLAQLAIADALGNAHMLGTLLAPYGVVAIPPEIFGHLLPLFIQAAPGVDLQRRSRPTRSGSIRPALGPHPAAPLRRRLPTCSPSASAARR